MQIMVGTESQKIPSGGRERPVIQNLGPGDVYIDTEGSVTPETGLRLTVNAVYEFPTSGTLDDIWIISSEADTDVRVIRVG